MWSPQDALPNELLLQKGVISLVGSRGMDVSPGCFWLSSLYGVVARTDRWKFCLAVVIYATSLGLDILCTLP